MLLGQSDGLQTFQKRFECRQTWKRGDNQEMPSRWQTKATMGLIFNPDLQMAANQVHNLFQKLTLLSFRFFFLFCRERMLVQMFSKSWVSPPFQDILEDMTMSFKQCFCFPKAVTYLLQKMIISPQITISKHFPKKSSSIPKNGHLCTFVVGQANYDKAQEHLYKHSLPKNH